MSKKNIKTAAIYYRYSSLKDQQIENSQKRQEDSVLQYCIDRQWTVEWKGGDDSVSGDKDKPKLMELKTAVEDKQVLVDVIVVATWDRLTRRHIIDFHEDVKWLRDTDILICTSQDSMIYDLNDNSDVMMLSFRVSEANRYLTSLSSNVRSGMESRFRRGELGWSRLPFGFDKNDNGDIVPNADLELVPLIYDMFLGDSINSCIPVMRRGLKYQKSGKAPSAFAVKCVLRNSVYIGLRTYGVAGVGRHGTTRGEINHNVNANRLEQTALPPQDISDKVKPVIEEDIFYKVQERLDSNKKKNPKRKDSKYKYAGFLRCSCGAKITASNQNNRITYVCPKSRNKDAGCEAEVIGRKTIREKTVEEWVENVSSTLLNNMHFHTTVLNKFVDHIRRAKIAQGTEGRDALREVDRLKATIERTWSTLQDMSEEDQAMGMSAIKVMRSQVNELEGKATKEEIEISSLLNAEYKETEWDVTGRYLNLMLELAKEVEELGHKTWKQAKQVKALLRELLKDKEVVPMLGLIDELSVKWHKVGKRCRPYRVEATWKVTQVRTEVDRHDGLKLGTYDSMDIRIVLYPVSGRVHATMELA